MISYETRLVAHFVVLLLALSVLFDLMGQTFSNWKDLSSRTSRLFSAVYLGILNEDSGKGSVASLLWHYMPAIILSLSIDIAWAPKESQRTAVAHLPPRRAS